MFTFHNYKYIILWWVKINYLLLRKKNLICKLIVRSESRDWITLTKYFFTLTKIYGRFFFFTEYL